AADPSFTYTTDGLVGSDTIAGVLSGSLSRDSGSNVGSYAIGQGSLAAVSSNYTISGFTTANLDITAKALTIAGLSAAGKVYDGTTTATVTGGTFSGLVAGDSFAVDATGVSWSFANANVAAGKTVSRTGDYATPSGNYTVTQPSSLTASITAKSVSVTADAKSKVYGAADPSFTYTTDGLVGSDTLSGSLSRASGANVGSYAITQGTLANANYTVSYTGANLTVTPKTLSITAPSIAAKTYNALAAAGTVTIGTLSGFVTGETVTATGAAAAYSSANAGSYQTTVSYTLADGTGGGKAANYTLASTTNVSGQITPKALTIGSPTISSKTYDGTAAPGSVTVGTLSGFVGSQTVTATAAAAAYSSANVGSYAGTVVSYTLADGANGGLATNYTLANGAATGSITAKALSVTGTTIAPKAYDASTAAGAVTVGTVTGLVGSETLGVTGTAGSFSSANVGSYSSTVGYQLADGTNGGKATNYTLGSTTNVSGQITPKTLSISAPSIAAKTYDGTTAPGGLTVGSLSGLVGSQTVSVSGSAAAYGSANAGSQSTTVSYTLGNGSNGGLASNYSLASSSANGQVTAKALTITANSVTKKPGTSLVTPVVGSTAFGSSGLVAGQAIGSVTINYGTGAAAEASSGTYAGQAVPSVATGGTFNAANYQISYQAGDIVVSGVSTIFV
ncbi:MAG: YDG domain-containing protein, partial [Planctomycetota bacterium]